MIVIAKKEFIEMTKSFKSLFIILIFILSSYFMGSFVSKNFSGLNVGSNDFTSATRLLVLLFGFLFVLMLSHDIVSRETSTKTIRFLITKTSRTNIIVGKFLGISAFWFFCLFISLSIVSFFAKDLLWLPFLQLYSFIVFVIGVCLLVSTLSKNTNTSLILSLTISFITPVFGIWSMFTEKNWLQPFKFLLPYSYQIKENGLIFVPFLFGLILLGLSIWYFKRGDY